MSSPSEKAATKAVQLLGVSVHPLTADQLKAAVAEAVEKNRRSIIANHNLHSVYLYHHDAAVRSFYARADLVHIDGMSLVLFGKLLGLRLSRRNRLTPLDWLRPLMAEAARRGWRIFYLGSAPGIADRGAEILRREFPGLLLDAAGGYFDARADGAENQNVVARINRYRPHLLLVGMGMPRQEHWILENAARVHAHGVNAIFNVGALMDYIAGAVPTPPRWLGPLGLEWLFRLASRPAHLWKRYLVEPWFVCGLFLTERAARGRAAGE
jgi:N-acetylglucosaminyldiphosphoundecaprenol N-acetyl-beta-D-mannosaminyltransferase